MGGNGAGDCLILFKNTVSFCRPICAFSSEKEKEGVQAVSITLDKLNKVSRKLALAALRFFHLLVEMNGSYSVRLLNSPTTL